MYYVIIYFSRFFVKFVDFCTSLEIIQFLPCISKLFTSVERCVCVERAAFARLWGPWFGNKLGPVQTCNNNKSTSTFCRTGVHTCAPCRQSTQQVAKKLNMFNFVQLVDSNMQRVALKRATSRRRLVALQQIACLIRSPSADPKNSADHGLLPHIFAAHVI